MEAHKDVLIELGKLTEAVNRVDQKVAIQNGSVAKHEQRLNNQDVMNAQTTITQHQILEELKNLKEDRQDEAKKKELEEKAEIQDNLNERRKWVDRIIWSIIVPGVSFIIILTLTKLGILNLA